MARCSTRPGWSSGGAGWGPPPRWLRPAVGTALIASLPRKRSEITCEAFPYPGGALPSVSSSVTVNAWLSAGGAVVVPGAAVSRRSTRKVAVSKVPSSSRLPAGSTAAPPEPSAVLGASAPPTAVQPCHGERVVSAGAAGLPPVTLSRTAELTRPPGPSATPASPLTCSRGLRTGREKLSRRVPRVRQLPSTCGRSSLSRSVSAGAPGRIPST